MFDEYLCPALYGTTISVSQMSTEERQKVQSLVEANGGKYQNDLSNENTHLILKYPNGAKYEFAINNPSIKIVSEAWFRDSIADGHRLDEKRYPISPDEKEFQRITDADCSLQDMPVDASFQVNIVPDPIDKISITCNQEILDGVKMFFLNFDPNRIKKFQQHIASAGGCRFAKLNERVTHIIVGLSTSRRVVLSKELGDMVIKQAVSSPALNVVTDFWLIDCLVQRKSLPIDPSYDIKTSLLFNCRSIKNFNKTNNSIEFVHELTAFQLPIDVRTAEHNKNSLNSLNSKSQDTLNDFEENDVYMDQIISEYVSSTNEVTENNHARLLHFSNSQNESTKVDKSQFSKNENSKSTQPSSNPLSRSLTRSSTSNLFLGLNFYLIPELSAKQKMSVLSLIRKHEGTVLNALDESVDYAIHSLLSSSQAVCFDGFLSLKHMTFTWIEACVEAGILLPGNEMKDDWLFTPIFKEDIDFNPHLFVDLSISISQFFACRRKVLLELVALLGGEPQEVFVKRSNNQHRKTTHLLAQYAEGQKYEAAVEYGSHVISSDWVRDSILRNEKQDEVHYSIRKLSSSSCEINQDAKSFHSTLDRSISHLTKDLGINQCTINTSVFNAENELFNVLRDKNIAISNKLFYDHSQLVEMASTLGAKVTKVYSPSCTHLLFQGKTKDTSKEYRRAKKDGKLIVSPGWLYACYENKSYISESDYPYNINPSFTLNTYQSQTRTLGNKPSQEKSLINKNEDEFSGDSSSSMEQIEKDDSSHSNMEGVVVDATSSKQLFGDIEARQKLQNLLSIRNKMPKYKSGSSRIVKHPITQDSQCSQRINTHSTSSSAPDFSQISKVNEQLLDSFTVVWDDSYANQQEKESLKNHLYSKDMSEKSKKIKCDENSVSKHQITCESKSPALLENLVVPSIAFPFQQRKQFEAPFYDTSREGINSVKKFMPSANPFPSALTEGMNESGNTKNNLATSQSLCPENVVNVRRFVLTGLSVSDKTKYSAIIEDLGGEISDSIGFDKEATHIICRIPLKTEKILAAISSGLWILHKSYLEACLQQNRFLEISKDLVKEYSEKILRIEYINAYLCDPTHTSTKEYLLNIDKLC